MLKSTKAIVLETVKSNVLIINQHYIFSEILEALIQTPGKIITFNNHETIFIYRPTDFIEQLFSQWLTCVAHFACKDTSSYLKCIHECIYCLSCSAGSNATIMFNNGCNVINWMILHDCLLVAFLSQCGHIYRCCLMQSHYTELVHLATDVLSVIDMLLIPRL